MNINCIPCGDCFIPDFAIALETESLGKYGRMRHTYLREHRPELYQDLVLSGRADATLNAELSFYDFMKEHPDANLKIVALSEEASRVAIPVRKGEENAAFLAAVNEAIEALRSDGTLREISMRYFNTDITSQN